MKEALENGELSPQAEGLAKLKYDPEEKTSLELATSYKEDGNLNFKHKNYRMALMGYTGGIEVKCGVAEMEASLYNNRSACHWQLKNYRSALADCEKALALKPDYTKARLRAAKCVQEITKYDACIEHCQTLLELQPDNKEVLELLATVKNKKITHEIDQRKKEQVQMKNNEQKEAIVKAIIQRGIKVLNCEDKDDINLAKLKPSLPGVQDSMVFIEDGILKWPVLFTYPEYQMTDFVKGCPENVPLSKQLEQLFPAPWDHKNRYSLSSVNVYFEGYDKMPHLVNPESKLCDVLLMEYYELKAGTPDFFILLRGSKLERRFLENFV